MDATQTQGRITVREALELPEMRAGDPELIAGSRGLDREIRWAHVVAGSAAVSLLDGGELVLTTGAAWPRETEGLAPLAARLVAADPAAVVLELGRNFDATPPPLAEACEAAGIPLVVLHREVRFVQITQRIHQRVLAEQHEALAARAEVHSMLTELGLNRSPVDYVVERLSDTIGAPVVLEDSAGRVVAWSGSASAEQVLAPWAGQAGTPGAAGTAGARGTTGAAGAEGTASPAGTASLAGAANAAGAVGAVSAAGAIGTIGAPDTTGGAGAAGTANAPNVAGATGAANTAGRADSARTTSTTGAQSATGMTSTADTTTDATTDTTTDATTDATADAARDRVPVEAQGRRWGHLTALPGPPHPAGRRTVLELGAFALALGRLADPDGEQWLRLGSKRVFDVLLGGRYRRTGELAAQLAASGLPVDGRVLIGATLRGIGGFGAAGSADAPFERAVLETALRRATAPEGRAIIAPDPDDAGRRSGEGGEGPILLALLSFPQGDPRIADRAAAVPPLAARLARELDALLPDSV
ncbi:MAG: PucR family transcriptional regulator ligand-binding domain-containing protein, partial [Leucobacter sp.]